MKADKPTATVADRVKNCIVSCFPITFDEVKPETEISRYGDSLDYVELLMCFEEEFGIECNEDAADYQEVKTCQQAIDYVQMCLDKKEKADALRQVQGSRRH